MQSFFPKALWYKEWVQQRWLFVLGIFWMSLSPGLQVVTFAPASKQYFNDVTLPGLEYLIPVYGIGLATLSLREMCTDVNEPFVYEPIQRTALLRTKFMVGAIGTLLIQAIVSGWYGLVLQSYPVSFPFIMVFGTWLLLSIGTLTCYAITFAICLFIRPLGLGVFFTIVSLLIPYIVANWFRSLWIPDHPLNVGWIPLVRFPHWASQVYTGLQHLSPLSTANMLPHDLVIGRTVDFYTHSLLPVALLIVSYLCVEYWGGKSPLHPFRSDVHQRGSTILQVVSSLLCALIAAKYFFGSGQMTTAWMKIIIFCTIWLLAHLILKALLSLGRLDKDKRRIARGVHR